MDPSKHTYDSIKKNIIFEDKLHYKQDQKQYITCLVKTEYADESESMKLYLFENRYTKNLFTWLDLIEYEKAEKCCIEPKKDAGWKFSPLSKPSFCFELIPKHSPKKEIFICDTEDTRNNWLLILNKVIEKLRVESNETYGEDLDVKPVHGKNSNNGNVAIVKRPGPPIPPKPRPVGIIPNEIGTPATPSDESLNYIVLNPKILTLNLENIFYQGKFEDLYKILHDINKSGVFAVSQKNNPELDCTLALRVYENDHSPILSWNIYQNRKHEEYFISENGPKFSNIIDLCSHYTKNDLPVKSTTINRLTVPYRYHYH
ncbi:unnamed protein product [Adineta steineri]|uniref:SH2 domain-containing protein n=1 Tax=Adineta steineri TaxID=433720 RepID=A0A815TH23_9BILA|nr:unnamed protein product [Adineta steineri]CAF3871057.1 unnamed protein product [Adineta steineri]